MASRSLKKNNSELADSKRQLEILSNGIFDGRELPTFAQKIEETKQFPLRPKILEILQIKSLVIYRFEFDGRGPWSCLAWSIA